jgi:hypothetical protein
LAFFAVALRIRKWLFFREKISCQKQNSGIENNGKKLGRALPL